MSFELVYAQDQRDDDLLRRLVAGRMVARLVFGWSRRAALYDMIAQRLRDEDGTTVEQAIELYARRLERRHSHAGAAVLRNIHEEMVGAGRRLADALQFVVPRDEYFIINAGERADGLGEALELLLDLRVRTGRIKRAAMKTYGMLLFYTLLVYANVFLIARYSLPSLQMLASIGNRAKGWMDNALDTMGAAASGPAITYGLGFAGVSAALIAISLPRLTGPVRLVLEHLPPWSTYRNIQGYVWLSTYVVLVRSGRPETLVLQEQAENASRWLRERLVVLHELMENQALLFPRALEESGLRFPSPDVIDDIANAWGGRESAYDRLLKTLRTWAAEIEKTATRRSLMVATIGTAAVWLISGFITLASMNYGDVH